MHETQTTGKGGCYFIQLIARDDFRAYCRVDKGCFVITDTANPMRIHDVRCSQASEARFGKKVVKNRSKNGKYI